MSRDRKVLYVNGIGHNVEGLRNIPGTIPIQKSAKPAARPAANIRPTMSGAGVVAVLGVVYHFLIRDRGRDRVNGSEALALCPAANETLTANCVLAEDTEVGTDADAVAIAYRTGHFNANMLTVYSTSTSSVEKMSVAALVGK